MNDVTGNYLWLAPLKLNLFPLYIFSALLRTPCFQGLDLIQPTSSFGQKGSFIRFLPQATEFYGVDLGLGPPVAWLCLSSIFTVLARAQK